MKQSGLSSDTLELFLDQGKLSDLSKSSWTHGEVRSSASKKMLEHMGVRFWSSLIFCDLTFHSDLPSRKFPDLSLKELGVRSCLSDLKFSVMSCL